MTLLEPDKLEPAPRIALVITGLEVGGAEQACTNLALGLCERGFSPTVYALRPRPPAGEDRLAVALERGGVVVEFLDARSSLHAPRTLHRLTALLRRDRPALVQTFLYHANLLGRFAAGRAGVSHVVCGIRVAERRGRARLWLDRATSRRVEHYVCVSRDVAEFSRRVGGLPAEKLSVIPNGVDVERFAEAEPLDLAELGVAAGRRAIVCVGRLDEQKRSAWLAMHAPQLFERLPQHDLVFVGDGPQRDIIYSTSKQLGVADRVHLVGRRDDVPRVLRACDLLVLPSAWEGMPNVVLEAMAAALPVVATQVEGVCELLGPGAAAQTIPVGDQEALVLQAFSLLSHPTHSQQVGAENQRRVRENFSLPAMCEAYAALYRRLLAARR